MSLVIAYLVIGLITAVGRLLDHPGEQEQPWDAIDAIEWLLMLVIVTPIITVAWPYALAVGTRSK